MTREGYRDLTWNSSWSWQCSVQRTDSPVAFQTLTPGSEQKSAQGYPFIVNRNLLRIYCVPGTTLRTGDTAANKPKTILTSRQGRWRKQKQQSKSFSLTVHGEN